MPPAKHVVMNHSRITNYIFLGTNACCLRHFDMTLLHKGVVADISLQEERIDAPQGVRYFLWIPTQDHSAPSQKALALGSDTISWCVSNKQKVYVHCLNGHGRSPALVAAYLMKYQNMSVSAAIAYIKKRRPEIHLEPSQTTALQKFKNRSQG